MAYYIRKGLVEENIETLEMLYDIVRLDEPRSFKAASPKKMNSIRHHFRKVLAAAERLPNEAGGRFKDLRSRIEVSLDWERMEVTVLPKQTAAPLIPAFPDENDMVEVVKSYKGKLCMLKFAPSSDFDPKVLDLHISRYGFNLAKNPETGDYAITPDNEEHGTIMMVAERTQRQPKTDLLKQFGFSRDDS